MDRLIKVFRCILITESSESFASSPVVLKKLIPVVFNFFFYYHFSNCENIEVLKDQIVLTLQDCKKEN